MLRRSPDSAWDGRWSSVLIVIGFLFALISLVLLIAGIWGDDRLAGTGGVFAVFSAFILVVVPIVRSETRF